VKLEKKLEKNSKQTFKFIDIQTFV